MQLLEVKPARGDGYHIQASDGKNLRKGGCEPSDQINKNVQYVITGFMHRRVNLQAVQSAHQLNLGQMRLKGRFC